MLNCEALSSVSLNVGEVNNLGIGVGGLSLHLFVVLHRVIVSMGSGVGLLLNFLCDFLDDLLLLLDLLDDLLLFLYSLRWCLLGLSS